MKTPPGITRNPNPQPPESRIASPSGKACASMPDFMKKAMAFAILSLIFFASAVRSQSSASSAEQVTVIRAGSLIDGSNGSPRRNQLIFVRGNRIEKVAEGSAQIPAGAVVIDLSAATVLPGLIDSHTHIFLWGEDPAKGGYDENILKAGIALFFFFFNDTATTEIYTLSLHDALPILIHVPKAHQWATLLNHYLREE